MSNSYGRDFLHFEPAEAQMGSLIELACAWIFFLRLQNFTTTTNVCVNVNVCVCVGIMLRVLKLYRINIVKLASCPSSDVEIATVLVQISSSSG